MVARRMKNNLIVGIDEAGRGPLAGPVVASAVILLNKVDGLNDSKKLSEKERERLSPIIKANSIWAVGYASAEEIDSINILNATFLAMERAAKGLFLKTEERHLHFMIDGNIIPPFLKEYEKNLFSNADSNTCITAEAIVKGDSKVSEIMAASIISKTERDHFMKIASTIYPNYDFEKHKGYGTKSHFGMIEEYGLSPLHRRSFNTKTKS